MEQVDRRIIVGRNKELNKIDRAIKSFLNGHRTAIAIMGEPGSGKTALLYEIRELYKDVALVIFVRADAISNPHNFIREISRQVDYYPPEMNDWKIFGDIIFSYMLSSNKKYLMIIDDFHFLTYGKDSLIPYLRSKYQEMDNLLLIVSMRNEHRDSLLAYDKAFFGQFDLVSLDPLSKRECADLLKHLLPESLYIEPAVNCICKFCDGIPEYIKMFSSFIISVTAFNRFDKEDVEQTINDILDKSKLYFRDYLESVIGKGLSPQAKAILKVFANNDNKVTVSQIASELDTDTGAISTQLKRLINKGVVYKDENSNYCIKNYIRLMLRE